jgi:hypothetical protein
LENCFKKHLATLDLAVEQGEMFYATQTLERASLPGIEAGQTPSTQSRENKFHRVHEILLKPFFSVCQRRR